MLDLAVLSRPKTQSDVLDLIQQAAERKEPVEVVGQGSRRGVGHHVDAAHVLDLSELSGVISYEPDELVLTAKAGTSLAEIERLLAAEKQELAFEPIDHGLLFGHPAGRGTLGGVIASNASGPRRLKAGAARDHVLGVHAVSGRGEAFKSGGRVVKNVTGYDLSKGMAGSWGTLAVITEISVKVLPRAETSATIAIMGLDDKAGVAALCAAMGSAAEISGAAHIPAAVAANLPVAELQGASCTLMRLEGFEPSVVYRAGRVAEMFATAGEIVRVDADASAKLWRSIRDVEPFAGLSTPLWRFSVTPMEAPAIVDALARQFAFRHVYDWSGGLIWLEPVDAPSHGHASVIRAAIQARGGGHATLIRSANVTENVPRFEPQPAALAGLSQRLKEGFDPLNILNPGRMG
ncbi:glycolate oxidase subunit GlcE [Flaviflagellibacter deserti]|uniref:Glycolate oxidase subunit GlcE n=1 Tax=Flaviflagellibacter deserti TaxID=2267266 RepID=A0ABV9Z4E8_9HYPH